MNTETTLPEQTQAPLAAHTDGIKPPIPCRDLSSKALILELHISLPTSSKKDKRVTASVAQNENAEVQVVRVVKSLLRGEAMSKLLGVASNLRQTFYKRTSPWDRESNGIIRIQLYEAVKLEMEALMTQYREAVITVVSQYEAMIEGDKARLGAMFNANDYLSKGAFEARFGCSLTVKAVEKSDFRTNALTDDEVNRINRSTDERVAQAVADTKRDSASRVQEKLVHLLERLQVADKQKFHATTIARSLEALDEARSLNIADDEKLSAMFDNVENILVALDPEAIRKSEGARKDSIKATRDAMSSIKAAMDGFSL